MYKRSTFNDIEKQKVKAYLKNDKGNLIFKKGVMNSCFKSTVVF